MGLYSERQKGLRLEMKRQEQGGWMKLVVVLRWEPQQK